MKRVKSYSSIWHVDKVIYALFDFNLPVPLTVTQILWLVSSIVFLIMFKNIPPFSFISNFAIKYIGIPVAFTWFMSKKTFDGKSPFSFLKSAIGYFLRYKVTYSGRKVNLKNEVFNAKITVV